MTSKTHVCGCFIIAVLVWSGFVVPLVTCAAESTVFESIPAPTIPVIREGVPLAGGPLRMLTIQERVGVARTSELVRVPLFFHPGECSDPDGLVIYDLADPTKKAIPYQADDVRKAESGEIARMHVYFYADLKPWERKQFGVIKGRNPGAALPLVSMQESGQNVVFKGDDISVGFIAKGPRAGAVMQLETKFGKLNMMDGFIAPDLRLIRQDPQCKALRRSEIGYDKPEGFEVREIKYAAGPLFAKLRVKIGPVGVPDSAETTFLIPKTGSLLVITQRTFADDPETGDVVGSNRPVLLRGRVTFGTTGETAVGLKIPTGLRKIIREAQNQNVEAAVAEKSGFSVINIPPVTNGGEIHYQGTDPRPEHLDEKGKTIKADPPRFTMSFMGPGSLLRNLPSNSGTLRSFWIQSRLVFAPTTDVEKLWDDVRAGQNSLVAVVDEPGLGVDDLAKAFAEDVKPFYAIKNWGKGWQQTAAMEYLAGKEDAVKKMLAGKANTPKESKRGDDATFAYWAPAWVQEQAKEINSAKPPLMAPKGYNADKTNVGPYNLGYAMSSIVPFAARIGPSDRLDQMCHSIGRASMLANGGLYKEGFPHINTFSNAYNMQVGSMYFGIYSGKKLNDPWMTMFYRDITHGNGVACIYGHGERCYSSDMRNGEQSDILYQAITDLWIRNIELVCNENLQIHPATYSRYTDTIDVTADQEQRSLDGSGHGWYRGNFFRAQSHDHRWESWDAMPYAMLQENADEEVPVGITEAIYFARHFSETTTNKFGGWSQLLNFFHPLFNLKTARHDYQPPKLPPLPRDVKAVAADGSGARITWSKVEDAVGYRIYRSDKIGKPLTFLNSPYVPEKRADLVKETSYTDPEGSPDKFYFVTAVDKDGHESSWFPDEPTPRPGKNSR